MRFKKIADTSLNNARKRNCDIVIDLRNAFDQVHHNLNNTQIYNLNSVPQSIRFLLGNTIIFSKTNPHSGSKRQ